MLTDNSKELLFLRPPEWKLRSGLTPHLCCLNAMRCNAHTVYCMLYCYHYLSFQQKYTWCSEHVSLLLSVCSQLLFCFHDNHLSHDKIKRSSLVRSVLWSLADAQRLITQKILLPVTWYQPGWARLGVEWEWCSLVGFLISTFLFARRRLAWLSCQKKDQVGGKGAQLTSIDFGLHCVLICLCPNLIYVKQSATNPPDEKRISQHWDEIPVWLLCNNAADCLQYWLFAQICANIEWQCRDREVWEREGSPGLGSWSGQGSAHSANKYTVAWDLHI